LKEKTSEREILLPMSYNGLYICSLQIYIEKFFKKEDIYRKITVILPNYS